MHDPRLDRLADVLVRYCAEVKRGDLVTILGEPECMPAVEAIFTAVLKAGGHPSFHTRGERLQELLLTNGSDEQLTHVCPFERHRLAHCDVLMVLRHPINTRALTRVDPARSAMAQAARRGLMADSIRRGSAGSLRYVLTEIPGNAAAQDAEMSLSDYADWVYRAGFLDRPDPVAAWRSLHARQEVLRTYLEGKRVLRFVAPPGDCGPGRRQEGTDLLVDVSGRTWVNCAGRENFPDGEVFSGPRDVEGVVHFPFPAVYRGVEVEGVRLAFKGGRVVEASAAKNEAYLHRMIEQDEGARIVGEIAIGTNYEIRDFSCNTFFDEKIGGTFHLALGAGFPETGNTNESGLHWDMVCDLRAGGEIYADGELFHANGEFLLPEWTKR
jgi:aminopeptidase